LEKWNVKSAEALTKEEQGFSEPIEKGGIPRREHLKNNGDGGVSRPGGGISCWVSA
jgi:hypothetical protein